MLTFKIYCASVVWGMIHIQLHIYCNNIENQTFEGTTQYINTNVGA